MKKSLLITITLAVSLLLGFTGCANNSDDTTLMMVAINNYNNENVMRDITAEDLAVIKSWNSVKFSYECHTDREIKAGFPTQFIENDSWYNIQSTEENGTVQYYWNFNQTFTEKAGYSDKTDTIKYSEFVSNFLTSSSSQTVQINNNRTKIIITNHGISSNSITTFTKQ